MLSVDLQSYFFHENSRSICLSPRRQVRLTGKTGDADIDIKRRWCGALVTAECSAAARCDLWSERWDEPIGRWEMYLTKDHVWIFALPSLAICLRGVHTDSCRRIRGHRALTRAVEVNLEFYLYRCNFCTCQSNPPPKMLPFYGL